MLGPTKQQRLINLVLNWMKRESCRLQSLPQPKVFSRRPSLRGVEGQKLYCFGDSAKENKARTSKEIEIPDIKKELIQIKDGMVKLFATNPEDSMDLEFQQIDVLHQTLKREVSHLREVEERLRSDIDKIKHDHLEALSQMMYENDLKAASLARQNDYQVARLSKASIQKDKTIAKLKEQMCKLEEYYHNLMRVEKSSYDFLVEQIKTLEETIASLKQGQTMLVSVENKQVELPKNNAQLQQQLRFKNMELQSQRLANTKLRQQAKFRDDSSRFTLCDLESQMTATKGRLCRTEQHYQSKLQSNSQEIVTLKLALNSLQSELFLLTNDNTSLRSRLSEVEAYTDQLQLQLETYICTARVNHKARK